MLAHDFTEVGASGALWSRADVLETIGGLVLVSYETPGTHRTSLWRRTPGGWRVVFHQGTRMPTNEGETAPD